MHECVAQRCRCLCICLCVCVCIKYFQDAMQAGMAWRGRLQCHRYRYFYYSYGYVRAGRAIQVK